MTLVPEFKDNDYWIMENKLVVYRTIDLAIIVWQNH